MWLMTHDWHHMAQPTRPMLYATERLAPAEQMRQPTKAETCLACHAVASLANRSIYPQLAGQNARYLEEQIRWIASGQRSGNAAAAMMPFVQSLSTQDIRDIAAWFASLPPMSSPASPNQSSMQLQRGRQLYQFGDDQHHIPACLACHGPSGAGNPMVPYPRIRGQSEEYLMQRLMAYQQTKPRPSQPPSIAIMAEIAGILTQTQIQDLSGYLAQPQNPAMVTPQPTP